MNDTAQKQSWWQRLSGGLKRTSSSIGGAISDLVSKRKLDAAMLDELEDVLIRADLGVDVAATISDAVGEGRYDKAISPEEVKAVVAAEVEKVLAPVAKPLAIDGAKPFIILVAGVNGSGKTTTIGKLAASFAPKAERDAGGRRHVPRRRHRSAEDLGRAHRCAGDRARARLRRGRPRLRGAHRGEGAGHRHPARSTPPAGCRTRPS